ncbi:MAG: hypothetical protein KJ905_01065 [Nanoarchaeota archaeon]|nr:hypothetical protein [Nanoarchaeota archaeon]MBU1501349.1 hypothetical protein [Nanoarchaeota archaeon]MBU2459287.1 hypothetical protein [Nanoarchaeota archaeon]
MTREQTMLGNYKENYFEKEFPILVDRIIDVMANFFPETCDDLGSCTYVIKRMLAQSLGSVQARGYAEVICKKYPLACELNRERLGEVEI